MGGDMIVVLFVHHGIAEERWILDLRFAISM